MNIRFPNRINSNYSGYRSLIDFYHQTNQIFPDKVIINFQGMTWFDANLLAVLGAVLSNVENNLNDVVLTNIDPGSIENLWRRNHFLTHFGGYPVTDYNETTIKYRKFKTTEEKVFKDYLDNELLSKKALPEMTSGLKKKINESIFEIFNNAVIHGNCKHIFSCGQYYPNLKKLDFTIVDLGITIKANVKNYLRRDLESYISWAVEEGNTTKQGNIPGGLGLSLIREFLQKNQGKIQIVSANEYWEQDNNNIIAMKFYQEFPGTIVNLEFNLNDRNSYFLVSEKIRPEDIF